jgi:RNA polymerase sigma-70 factor (ECF subfamily)
MHNQEKQILTRLKQGDKEVFRELFGLYYTKLYLYTISYVKDSAVADDIVQDIFFHLWERHRELDIFSSISAYLFRAVHNKSIQYLRHRKVIAGYEERYKLNLNEAGILFNSSADFSFSSVQLAEIHEILNKTYDALPEKARAVFRLSREEEKTNKDIARILNINIKTVEYYIRKSLRVLRFALRDYIVGIAGFIGTLQIIACSFPL